MTAFIELTKGHKAQIDDIDADLADLKWTARESAGCVYAGRYFRVDGKRTMIYLQQIILSRVLDRSLQKDEKVSHKDGNSLNDRRSNLRLAAQMQVVYAQKRHKNNKSGYKGVSWDDQHQLWHATIQSNGKKRHLGFFKFAIEASNAYAKAARELHGDFANLDKSEVKAPQESK